MQLHCPHCRAKILSEDVSLDVVMAKCRGCHAVFDFSDQVERADPPPEAKAKRDRGEVPMPPSLHVEEAGNTLTVTRKWGRGIGCFFLFFSGFWNSIVSVFVVAALSGEMDDGPGNFIFLFLTPFILVGLGTGYAAVALMLNRTTVRVSDGSLTVRHHPIPWPGNRTVGIDDLDQLFCKEYVAYSKNNVPQYRFAVHAVMKGGDRKKLIPGMETPEQAVALEQLLERRLGIQDRAVRGELDGR